jgi:hypothetical protein
MNLKYMEQLKKEIEQDIKLGIDVKPSKHALNQLKIMILEEKAKCATGSK